VDGCDCGGAQSSSVSGDVTYTGTLTKGGRYVFNSHSGDIVVVTPSGFELERGDVQRRHARRRPHRPGRDGSAGPGRTRRGTVGGGGAVVEAKTFSGDLRISRPK
jgi:hypothetical protein